MGIYVKKPENLIIEIVQGDKESGTRIKKNSNIGKGIIAKKDKHEKWMDLRGDSYGQLVGICSRTQVASKNKVIGGRIKGGMKLGMRRRLCPR